MLEGFPSNENESNYLIEKGYYADAAISLNISDDAIIKRLLPPRVDRWREKVKQRQERRNKKKEEKRKELVGFCNYCFFGFFSEIFGYRMRK